ncbi:hypothetical protein ABMA27_003254 [Loxostege sticticalis]|uniref:Regulatory protein zeste n=1 Tax=Loxostege sticticalis TaxID=481309 RepID=A0ABR3HSJ5_LOXSC
MKRTSFTQFTIMVEFMERYGDLSKPSGGPHGRQHNIAKWKELTNKLNSEGSGDSRNEEKWRKVWSDFKNGTKKKAAKLRNSMRGTGGGPALKICLTDLEQRVMAIIGEQAATGMQVPEVGFAEDDLVEQIPPIQQEPEDVNINVIDEDWNMPGTSEDPIIISTQDLAPPMPSPPATTPEPHWTPPPPKKRKITKTSTAANAFIQCERERDEKYIALERERIRQRDTELQLQAQWLDICKEILKMIREYLSKDNSA